ncbi:MAG TPA: ABC-ATPase UvrA, partial [Bdellovibrionota bacterium]|nr:ABC-ATPase UvrA [Bdellovibrionota bacterium]
MPLGNEIIVKGAREHNLKNLSVTIPRDKLVVITGISGSGKSSLAFDTIFAEGQRRYVESLSAYARQFLEQMKKPDVDLIDGLSPAISITQQSIAPNPRSTVGTITEVYDFLRLLFARVGHPFCYQCGSEIRAQSSQQMVDHLVSEFPNSRLTLLSPIIRGRKGIYQKELDLFRRRGFARVYVNGTRADLSSPITLDKQKKHDIDLEIDRIIIKPLARARLAESIELALREGRGAVKILLQDSTTPILLSEKLSCPNCGISYPELEPRLFSFNSPYGACPQCKGLGIEWENGEEVFEEKPLEPVPVLTTTCSACSGSRLRRESLYVKVGEHNIANLCSQSISALLRNISQWSFSRYEGAIANPILKEVKHRLQFLENVGVGYLSLDRGARSLSGGEGQRIRLASQIGTSLTGVLYILDEPSIGLHQRDIQRLLDTLFRLRDLGNTVLVVEHDEETIRAADYLIDIGPGAGVHGGELLIAGRLEEIISDPNSITGAYLSGSKKIPLPTQRRKSGEVKITLQKASLHNLKQIDVSFPIGLLTCVTGVSGSGKSTLVLETLLQNVHSHLQDSKAPLYFVDEIRGLENLDKVIHIDHSPIGRTPRSNPATYSGLFSILRDLFSQVPEARLRGYKSGRFSFNVEGGRCESCQGGGMVKIEMHFLPPLYIECE